MEIKKDKDNLIVTIPLRQTAYDAVGDEVGQVSNIMGVIAGDEMTFSQEIDMTYKGKASQEGMPLIHYYGEENEFKELCHNLGISYIKHSICAYCNKVIYGAYTLGDKGNQCFSCEVVAKKRA